MKIAHLIAQFYPYLGGAEICVHNVCESLSKAGHSATVICTTPAPATEPTTNYETIHIFSRLCGLLGRYPLIGKHVLWHILSSLQKERKFDLWQVTMGYPLGIYAVDFFKKNRIPCILRCCGEDIQKYPEIGYGYRLDEKINRFVIEKYPLFDGFVALTPSVKDEYLKLGIPEKKIHIIPNGVDTEKFAVKRLSFDRKTVRRKLGLDENILLILTVGRYHPKKGFDLIPQTAKILRSKKLNFQWVVVGKNTSEIIKKFPACPGEIRCFENMACSGGEILSLPSSELIELYCASDLFVLPTLIETFGMVLVEAMAAGLPIITTDTPGVRDVIIEGLNGIKVQSGNSESLADMIFSLHGDNVLRSNLSENSLNQVKELYDWNIVTGKYIGLYNKISKGHS